MNPDPDPPPEPDDASPGHSPQMRENLHELTQHPLRFQIFMILKLFEELNITQIAGYVKQSKSTVSRHLQDMEEAGILLAETGEQEIEGRIPPKNYRINPAFKFGAWGDERPTDPEALRQFLLNEASLYRTWVEQYKRTLDVSLTLTDMLEQLAGRDVDQANALYEEFFLGPKEPYFYQLQLDDAEYEEFLKGLVEFMELSWKQREAAATENPTRAPAKRFIFHGYTLPLRDLFTLHKRKKEFGLD